MKATNEAFCQLLEQIRPYLDRKDMIGYAVARNTRKIGTEIREYLEFKEKLMVQYGESDPENPEQIRIKVDSDQFKEFENEILPIAEIEQDIDVFMLKYEHVAGVLSGSDILAMDWMLED